MDTKLKDIINDCKKDTVGQNCINCCCSEEECLENLLDIYNSKANEPINEINDI